MKIYSLSDSAHDADHNDGIFVGWTFLPWRGLELGLGP